MNLKPPTPDELRTIAMMLATQNTATTTVAQRLIEDAERRAAEAEKRIKIQATLIEAQKTELQAQQSKIAELQKQLAKKETADAEVQASTHVSPAASSFDLASIGDISPVEGIASSAAPASPSLAAQASVGGVPQVDSAEDFYMISKADLETGNGLMQ